jgi:hypothetical protein
MLFCVVAGRALEADDGMLFAPDAVVAELDVAASLGDGTVLARWRTLRETGVGGFRLLRRRAAADALPVDVGRVRSQGVESGSAYELVDAGARAGESWRYQLLMVSRHAPERQVAEWSGTIEPAAVARAFSVPVPAAVGASLPAPLAAQPQTWIGSGERVRAWTDSAPADRVRLSLREEGIYRVTAGELATASGWDLAEVLDAMAATNLSMSCQGAPVAWLADGADLLFYGLPAASRYAPENVYWVSRAPGSSMARRVMTPALPPVTNQWFAARIEQQGTNLIDRYFYCSRTDTPASYLAFTPLLFAGAATSLDSALPDCADGVWSGTATVNLISYYEAGTDEHAARLSVGHATVGEIAWTGEQYVSLSGQFSSAAIAGGVIRLTVRNIAPEPPWTGDEYTRFVCVSHAVDYRRRYRARNGALRCTGGDGNTVAVAGFATNDVLALDVTVANQLAVMEPVTLTRDGASGTWKAAFPCGGSGQVYQVVSKSGGVRQPAVRGVRDVDWSAPENGADYVILLPPEGWRDDFRAVLQPLADFRAARGLRTRIVDVESLYNSFSHGLVDPEAMRDFCAAQYPHGLSYLLLAGAGAIDLKHQRLSVNDYTACLIPSPLGGQRFANGTAIIAALDGSLGDVDGDGRQEVAIGRLPTTSTQALAVAVSKTLAYEGYAAWKTQASLIADWANDSDKYYRFDLGTDAIVSDVTGAGWRVVKHYVYSKTSYTEVRVNSLFPALQAGSGLFHFFGHSNNFSIGTGTKLLNVYSGHVAVENWRKTPIAVVIGCIVSRWQGPTETAVFVPFGLFAADTGFVAGLGATGYMLSSESDNLARALYAGDGHQGVLRLGDVLRRGLRRMAGRMPPERLWCFSLSGDPALTFDCLLPHHGTVLQVH